MRCSLVGIGVDGNCGDFHTPCRSDDPAGDLAAIGDQQFAKHRLSLRR
jgi:hypothetical protein